MADLREWRIFSRTEAPKAFAFLSGEWAYQNPTGGIIGGFGSEDEALEALEAHRGYQRKKMGIPDGDYPVVRREPEYPEEAVYDPVAVAEARRIAAGSDIEARRAGAYGWEPYDESEEEAAKLDIWDFTEHNRSRWPAIVDLWHWSTNYDAGKGPFALFLDQIGWSQDELGQALYNLNEPSLGYVELGKLSEATTEYLKDPQGARRFVDELMSIEGS